MSSLEVGIVGLPNAGKSTLFNALASRRLSKTGPVPFTTIDPFEAVVSVPDSDFEKLVQSIKPEKSVPATITFIDIAGLVKNAHQGEGLGNQFLAKIREVDLIVHVIRDFKNDQVTHVQGKIDPQEDLEIVNLELELGGITNKPVIYVLNVAEDELDKKANLKTQDPVITLCAKLEEELTDLTEEEKKEYLKELKIKESGLEKLIKRAYQLLNLITFYTIKGGKEVHAWSIEKGSPAIEAAEKVHTDFAQHFIKAEVINIKEFFKTESWQKAKEKGKIQLQGKDYQVQNQDIIEFKIGS